MNGDPRLSDPTLRSAIEEAAHHTELLLSVVSLWEIGRWVRTGRLRVPIPIADWTGRALDTPGLVVAPLDPDIALEAGNLPGTPPEDLADQLIIATARARDATVVTADSALADYGAAGHMRAQAVTA